METTLNTGEKRMVAKYKYMKHSTNQLTKYSLQRKSFL